MRLLLLTAALLCTTTLAMAQAPAPTPAAPAPAPVADRVVAKVDGQEIRASDLADAAQALPEQFRGMPPQLLYPMLVDQLVDRRILVIAAHKQGIDQDPQVQKLIARATESTMQNALLSREIAPTLTEDAIKARYDREYAGKTGEEEVRARHILVKTEDEAKQVIADLKGGKDFAEEAKAMSTDTAANAQGGDLGYFKRGDMLPEFAEAAFALQPGQITEAPVQTRFGWHVIKLEDRRNAPAPTLEEVHDDIRQQLIQEGVKRVLDAAREGIKVEKFAEDGSPAPAAPATAP